MGENLDRLTREASTDPATRADDPFAYAGERPHGCYEG